MTANERRNLMLHGLDAHTLNELIRALKDAEQENILAIGNARLPAAVRDRFIQIAVSRQTLHVQMHMILLNAEEVQRQARLAEEEPGSSESESEDEDVAAVVVAEVAVAAVAVAEVAEAANPPHVPTTAIQCLYESLAQADGHGVVVSLGHFQKTSSGLDHAKRFGATVVVNGTTFNSPGDFSTYKAAKQAVALIAVNSLGLVL